MRSMDYQTHIPTSLLGEPMQTPYGIQLWKIHEKIGNGPYNFPSVFGWYLPAYMSDSGPMVPTDLVSPETSLVTMPNVANTLNGMYELIKYGLGKCEHGFSTDPYYGSCEDDGQYLRSYGHLFYEPSVNASITEQVEELSLLLTGGRLAIENINKIVNACSSEPDTGSQFRCMQQLVVSAAEFHSTNQVSQSGEERVSTEESPGESETPSTESDTDYKAIVFYYLNGGMDSYMMLAPHTCTNNIHDKYRKIRGQSDVSEGLGLPLSRLLEVSSNNTAQPCTSFGIHEKLGALRDLYNNNDLLFIANAGLITKPSTVENYRENNVRLFSHDGMCKETQLVDAFDEYGGAGKLGKLTIDSLVC